MIAIQESDYQKAKKFLIWLGWKINKLRMNMDIGKRLREIRIRHQFDKATGP